MLLLAGLLKDGPEWYSTQTIQDIFNSNVDSDHAKNIFCSSIHAKKYIHFGCTCTVVYS